MSSHTRVPATFGRLTARNRRRLRRYLRILARRLTRDLSFERPATQQAARNAELCEWHDTRYLHLLVESYHV